jgi:hypothetical protein
MHVPERRPFMGLHLLKYCANLALSWAFSGGGKREVPGDFGVGLTALRGSVEEEYPSMAARGPALTEMSNKFRVRGFVTLTFVDQFR